MQKIGLGFVFVGALAWVVTGIVVFTSDSDGRRVTEGLVESDPSALVAGAYIGLGHGLYAAQQDPVAHSDEAWSGAYYDPDKAMFEYKVSSPLPAWYVSVFHGFGSLFEQLFSPRVATWGSVTAESESFSVVKAANEPLQPACVVTIVPNSVSYGGSATISWTSRNADKVILQGYGEVSRSGSLTVKYLTSTRAYALAVGGKEGSSSCYTVINVEPVLTLQ
jgi:hypothetical protein